MIEQMSNLAEQSRGLAQMGRPPAEAIAKTVRDPVEPLVRKVEAVTVPHQPN